MTPRRSGANASEPGWQNRFVEELGALGPEAGIPPAMMRVTAWLMVCQPPEQSAPQIQAGWRLSAAAVSTATRQLIAAGMLERVSRRGDRRIYHRLASGSWGPLSKQSFGRSGVSSRSRTEASPPPGTVPTAA